MAKGLKPGDSVTVRKNYGFKRDSEPFQQGLKRLKIGDVGTVVDATEGRSVLVEFRGIQAVISSQRLDRAGAPVAPRRRGRPPGSGALKSAKPAPAISGTGKPRGRPKRTGDTAFVNYNDSKFVTSVANTLLTRGGGKAEPDSVVVQIKLSELPASVQQQIQSLMQAKLALEPGFASGNASRQSRKTKS